MKKNSLIALLVLALLALGLNLTAQTTTKTSSPATFIASSTCVTDADPGDGDGGITDSIQIFNATAGITDVDIRVDIDHTFRADLQFHVQFTGGGGKVILAADHGAFDANDYYATFDDAAGSACSVACSTAGACTAGAPGSCQPDGSLAAFNGLTTPNTFTLAVCDDAGGDEGTLQVWGFTVTGPGLPVELQRFEIQ